MIEWQPIKSAPKDKKIILYGEFKNSSIKHIIFGYYEIGGYTEGWVSNGNEFYPTHWMPRPNPPEDKP